MSSRVVVSQSSSFSMFSTPSNSFRVWHTLCASPALQTASKCVGSMCVLGEHCSLDVVRWSDKSQVERDHSTRRHEITQDPLKRPSAVRKTVFLLQKVCVLRLSRQNRKISFPVHCNVMASSLPLPPENSSRPFSPVLFVASFSPRCVRACVCVRRKWAITRNHSKSFAIICNPLLLPLPAALLWFLN